MANNFCKPVVRMTIPRLRRNTAFTSDLAKNLARQISNNGRFERVEHELA